MIARPARSDMGAVVHNGKMWITGGYGASSSLNDVYSSTDGMVWTPATSSASFSARYGQSMLDFNNKMWLIGGYDGLFKNDVWESPGG